MARIFTCGFEENNATSTMWLNSNPTFVTSPVHSGTYAGRVMGSAAEYYQRVFFPLYNSGTIYTRFYWRTESLNFDNQICTFLDDGGVNCVQVFKLSTGNIRLKNNIPVTPTTVDTSTTVSINTWYRIEIRYLWGNGGGQLELRLYLGESTTPLETIQLTSQNTTSANTGIQYFILQDNVGASYSYYYDDVAINTDTGGTQNSWPGPGYTALVKPASNGSVTWTIGGSSPAATNWQGVSEVPGAPDDGVTYNFDSGTSHVERFNISTLPAGMASNAVMTLIDVYGRVSASASSGTMCMAVWDETLTKTNGGNIIVDSTTWRMLNRGENLALSTSGKTKANVQNFNIGYGVIAGSVEKRISSVWANVEWKDFTGTTVPIYMHHLRQQGIS